MSYHNSCRCKSDTCNCDCRCCGGESQFHRRFQTKDEQIKELETYLGDLKAETQAVEERLIDLRK